MLKDKAIKKIAQLNWKQKALLFCYYEIRNRKKRKLRLGKIAFFYHPPFSNINLVYGIWEMRYVNQPFADKDKKKILDLLNFIDLEPLKVFCFLVIVGSFIIIFFPPKSVTFFFFLINLFFPKFISFFFLILIVYSYPPTFVLYFFK